MSLATRRSSWPDDAAAAASSIRASPACQSPAKTWAMPLKLIAMNWASGSSTRSAELHRLVGELDPLREPAAISAPRA